VKEKYRARSAQPPKRPEFRDRADAECAPLSCRSLQTSISRKSAEILSTFQRAFLDRECSSSNPPRSARQSCVSRGFPRDSKMGRKYGLFACPIPSLRSRFSDLKAEICESLRPCPGIFPFCGDYRQRQVRPTRHRGRRGFYNNLRAQGSAEFPRNFFAFSGC
jgi:hypothetical protein